MSVQATETAFLIRNLQILQREIAIEGNEQLATMIKVFSYDIPEYIEKLRRLEELERGKVPEGFTKEAYQSTVRLHQSRHTAMHLRTIPD